MLSLTSIRISRLSACWQPRPTSARKGRTCGRTFHTISINCTNRGPNWAEATEGSASVWARERYDWSGNRVVGTTRHSNVFQAGGTWTLIAEPRNGAGSHIRVILDRRWKGKGWLFYPMVAVFGRQMLKRNLEKTLKVLAQTT
jgi:hypothetical protein